MKEIGLCLINVSPNKTISASPDSISIVCVLKASEFSGMVAKGQQIHSEVMIKGHDIEPLVGNTLVFIEHGVHYFLEALELHSNLSIAILQDNLEVFSLFVGCFLLLWST